MTTRQDLITTPTSKLLAVSFKPEKTIFIRLLRIIMIDAIFCVIPFIVTYICYYEQGKKKKGEMCVSVLQQSFSDDD